MEKTNTRLHPLLTAAAISLTIFSAVGVASLTGLLPQSIGSQKEEIIPQETLKPLEAPAPVISEAPKPVEADFKRGFVAMAFSPKFFEQAKITNETFKPAPNSRWQELVPIYNELGLKDKSA